MHLIGVHGIPKGFGNWVKGGESEKEKVLTPWARIYETKKTKWTSYNGQNEYASYEGV